MTIYWKMPFRTQETIENDFLMQEARFLTMPDGSQRSVTAFGLVWRHFDFLIHNTTYKETDIVELTLQSSAKTGMEFDAQFHDAVGYLSSFQRSNPTAAMLPKLMRIIYYGFSNRKEDA